MGARLLSITAAALLAAGAGCSESDSSAHPPKTKSAGAAPAKRGPPPAIVKVDEVRPGNIEGGWTFLGQVEPAMNTTLAPAVAGHVRAVKVKTGDRVKKNQVLVTLDTSRIAAAVAAARAKERQFVAELAQAERQWKRVEPLAPPTISVPERERFKLAVDMLSAKLASQRAETRQQQVELNKHFIRAPFSGVIRARTVNPGAWVSVGQSVLEVVSLDELEIHVNVSVDIGAKIKAGDKAKVMGPGDSIPAKVAGVVPALDTSTRTMRIRLIPEKKAKWLLPAMPVDVEFKMPISGGVMVHRDAVIRGPSGARVIKVEGDQGVPLQVEVIATAKGRALIRGDGVAVGDKVVIRGNERLRPGQPLKVVP